MHTISLSTNILPIVSLLPKPFTTNHGTVVYRWYPALLWDVYHVDTNRSMRRK